PTCRRSWYGGSPGGSSSRSCALPSKRSVRPAFSIRAAARKSLLSSQGEKRGRRCQALRTPGNRILHRFHGAGHQAHTDGEVHPARRVTARTDPGYPGAARLPRRPEYGCPPLPPPLEAHHVLHDGLAGLEDLFLLAELV